MKYYFPSLTIQGSIILITILTLIGCSKDMDTIIPNTNNNRGVSIEMSKDYFSKKTTSNYSQFTIDAYEWGDLIPAWNSAQEIGLNDSSTVVIVPIADSAFMVEPLLDSYIVFFSDSLDSIQMHLLIFQADSAIYSNGDLPELNSYYGYIWEFYDEEDTYSLLKVENGYITDCGCSTSFAGYISTIDSLSIVTRQKPTKCPRWKQTIFEKIGGWIGGAFSGLWTAVSNFFNNGGSPGHPGTGSIGFSSSGIGSTGGLGLGIGGHGGFGGSAGGGGTFPVNLANYFNEWELKKIQKVPQWMLDTYGVDYSILELFPIIGKDCILEISDFINTNNSIPTPGDEDLGPECAITAMEEMILEMFPYLTENDDEEIEFLLYNHYDRERLDTYASGNEERTERMKEYIELKHSNFSYKVDRFIELWDALDVDPFLLIQDCVETDGSYDLSHWLNLAAFEPSTTIENDLISKNYSLQLIQQAAAPKVNLDYFSIKIDVMPKNPNGTVMTEEDLLNHFRLNINDFSTFISFPSTFTPIPSDVTLWNSNNPTSTVVGILIPGNSGAVVLAEYQSGEWIFSTVQDNNTGGLSMHPVAGNRQFGITEVNGTKYFFIKGADRYQKWYANLLTLGLTYEFSDGLWNGTMNKFSEFINNNYGQSTKLPSIGFRPPWPELKNKLQSSQSILGVECD